MDYNNKEDELFQKWASFLGVTMDEFVSDGLLFHAGLKFDGLNYVRTTSGDNSFNWDSSKRRLLIITRDQPSDDGNVWDVRGEVPLKPDGCSFKPITMFKCLIPWSQAALLYDSDSLTLNFGDKEQLIDFWFNAPIARMNCGKMAGKQVKNGGCDRNKVISYIEQSKSFLLKQIQLYDANIIMCTTGYDSQTNPVIDFLKEMYLPDLLKVNNYLWFSVSQGKVVLDTYHFANFEMRADDKKISEANNIRDSLLDAKSKGYNIP